VTIDRLVALSATTLPRGSTKQPQISRNRIAKVMEATLLHHEHAPYGLDFCGFFSNLFLMPK
jgi:hypothetical protein